MGKITLQSREGEMKSAMMRTDQIIGNAQRELAAISVRRYGSATAKRHDIARAQGNLDRAKAAYSSLMSYSMTAKEIRQVKDQGTASSQSLAQQRANRSYGVSAPPGNPSNFEHGFTVASKEQGYSTIGSAETARQAAVAIQLSKPIQKEPSTNTGSGSTTDPFKASQPDQSKVSPFLNYTSPSRQEVQPTQGAVKQNFLYNVELQEGGNPLSTILPAGSLEYLYGQPPKVYDDKRYDDLGKAAYAGFGNALRYSDAVDIGEVEKPKGLEYLNYYASRGLRGLYNIPLYLMGDKNIQPTFTSTLVDVPIQLATTGKTETHDPIGDFVRKDPLATLVELPGEALLWVAGAKAVEIGGKAIQSYSPLLYQSKKIITGDIKPETIYRGITWNNKPVIGLQNKKVVIGYKESGIADKFSKVQTKSLGRDGMEAALGSGIEKELIYSARTLNELVARKIIPRIASVRALAVKQGVIMARGIKSKIGAFGKEPIEGLTQKQSDFLLTKVVKESKDIDLVHGSAALRPQLGDDIIKQAGSSVKLGDLDIVPKGKNLSKTADKLIQGFAKDFPLSPGQRLSIEGLGKGDTVNRALKLIGESDSIQSGQIVYHGTTKESAKQILKRGFRFDKSRTSNDTIFAAMTKEEAYGHKGSLLKITLKRDAKIFDVNKQKNPLADNDELRALARKDKSDIIKNMMQGYDDEIEIINTGAIKSIELIGGKGKWINPKLEKIGGKEPKKILEVVLRSTDDSRYGIPPGKKVLGEKIPFTKSVKATDYPIKLHTADFQLLTNVKQVLSFQKGSNTLLDIYPSSGRTKDIVRTYWNLKAKALFKSDKELDKQADYIRSLYKGIEFTDYKPEKVLLYSSQISSKPVKAIPTPLRPVTPKEVKAESKTTSKIEWNNPKITSRLLSNKIKPSRLQSRVQVTRPAVKSSYAPRPTSRIPRLIGSRKPSTIPTSKTPSIIPPPPSKPISVKQPPSKVPTSLVPPSPRPPFLPPSSPTIRSPPRTKSIYRIPLTRKVGAIIPIKTKDKTQKTIGSKKRGHDFLGNTRVAEITGFRTKKKDIDVGDKRTKKLYREDLLRTKRNYKKINKNNLSSLIGKPIVSLRL